MYQKKIELLLLDGNPNERILCNLTNWDGICFKIPRTKIKESKDRKELKKTGIYLLFGKNNDADAIYIGEAENIYERLIQHLSRKDFWNECIVFMKKDDSLNKAHIKYIENVLYNTAIEINRYIVENTTIPTKSNISEFDAVAMEEFIDYIKMLTNILGYRVFEEIVSEKIIEEEEMYYIRSIGLEAKGIFTNEGFVVFKGSESNNEFKKASMEYLRIKWSELRRTGIIENNKFTKDYLFASPSTAAAIILGRNANGLTEWKNKDKQTLKSTIKKDD